MDRLSSRTLRGVCRVLALLVLGASSALAQTRPSAATAAPAPGEYRFAHDHVLGTSLDVVAIASSEKDANAFDQAVVDEIDRLAKVLSTYEPTSEINKLTVAAGPTTCSTELVDVLAGYDTWRQRSGGAYSGCLGLLIKTWQDAQKANKLPESAELARVVQQIAQPAWKVEKPNRITRLNDLPLNVNSLGKGYIIDKAMAAARAKVPAVTGALVDIGGDVAVWGTPPKPAGATPTPTKWRLGVADPAHSQDNAPPLVELLLANQSVATSGSYMRFYTIGDRKYSHLFDPRTGKPAEGIASATVVAKDSATANPLATILCILKPEDGLALAKTVGAQCLIITADGKQLATPGWKALEAPRASGAGPANPGPVTGGWPKGFELNLTISIVQPENTRKFNRPYVAVWIEDPAGKPVRTLAVWGNERKYLKDLPRWWSFAAATPNVVATVTRATRPAGEYKLAWDGRDDAGKPAAPGTYTVRIESTREKGPHITIGGPIDCKDKATTARIAGDRDLGDVTVSYGPTESKP